MLELPVAYGVLEEARLSKHADIRVRGRVRSGVPNTPLGVPSGWVVLQYVSDHQVSAYKSALLQVWYTKEWGRRESALPKSKQA